ncbi:MAG: DUF805 domain-containing protein [Sphingobium sp.]|jgi:uncharacterized membrane protein YhaH (DUF805 family)|nr:DUF805 domain-containing protein [Sphingomonas sp.]
MDWMLLPLRRYATFGGRSRRKEYWMYALFLMLCMIGLRIIEDMFGFETMGEYAYRNGLELGVWEKVEGGRLVGLFALATLIPSIAVAVRRLHDTDRSGWWMLLAFIPLIGTLWLLILMVLRGTRGPNRFGPDPVGIEPDGY